MQNHSYTPIAIVGIGGIFPGAPTLEQFWTNIKQGISAAQEVPPGRWPLELDDIYAPERGLPDKVYSKRGCYITDFEFDAEGIQLDLALIPQLDPVFHLALHAARAALRDANLTDFNHNLTGVIIGNIALPTEKTSAITAEILGRKFEEQVLTALNPEKKENTRKLQTHPLNRYAVGMVAGMIAKAFGLGGGSFTVDGACAASLYALKFAVNDLQTGRADVMLTGGVCRPDSAFTQMGFSQLRALSPTGVCAPFDEQGDGLVVGEGAGIFVLKRLEDALREGNQIYAVIRGIGLSNDRQGTLLAPDSEGQVRAMQAAYQQAGWKPQDVDLIECHATGTPVGDAVEFSSLKMLWGKNGWRRNQCVIGGVKSNVGHLLTGAGAAGLMKTVLALKHQTLPPTANFFKPDPKLDLPNSPFTVLIQAQPWLRRDECIPRRAAVSAFGFGGINAHVLLEEWDAALSQSPPETSITLNSPAEEEVIAVVGLSAQIGPWQSLRSFQERVFGGQDDVTPASKTDSWGIDLPNLQGYFVDGVDIPFGQFRIPPKEMQESLPQQLLMLQVADGALKDAHIELDEAHSLRTGVFIGIGLDFNSTNFSYRWQILNKARAWAKTLSLKVSEKKLQAWIQSLRDAFHPPLTANRTVGALGGIVASRIAREFKVGGAGITISAEESSGLQALDVAVQALQRKELDHALVGAIDLNGDIRSLLATHAHTPFSKTGCVHPFDAQADGTLPGEGAVAVVLKRLDDAVRDGNRIYAVLKGIGKASGGKTPFSADSQAYQDAFERACQQVQIEPASVQYFETHGSAIPQEDQIEAEALTQCFPHSSDLSSSSALCPKGKPTHGPSQEGRIALGSVKAAIGHTGAASGVVSFVKACLCLYQEIIPTLLQPEKPIASLNNTVENQHYFPNAPQYWLCNRVEGPRRAGVACLSMDGNCVTVILESYQGENVAIDKVIAQERLQPLGARPDALFAVEGNNQVELLERLEKLHKYVNQTRSEQIETLARSFWQQQPVQGKKKFGAALLAREKAELDQQLEQIRHAIRNDQPLTLPGNRSFYTANPIGQTGELAFIFPGSGNHYPFMGRTISVQWPEILREQDRHNQYLRSQFVPELLWNSPSAERINQYPREILLGQVAYSTMMTDLLRHFGLRPQAVIGYSLGESSAFFALKAWTDRDEMLQRVMTSPLYTRDLAGKFLAVSRTWNLSGDMPADWVITAVQCPAEEVQWVLKEHNRVYLLIINTPGSCVLGGDRQAVQNVIVQLGCPTYPLAGVSAAHCEIIKQVEGPYRDLHYFKNTSAPAGIRFYSGAWSKAYQVTAASAADAILAQASDTIDFPAVIRQAYQDGVRVFIEIGPGNSCTNMIAKILENQPHIAASACAANGEDSNTILRLLGKLFVERVPVDFSALYGQETLVIAHQTEQQAEKQKSLHIPTGGQPFQIPLPEISSRAENAESAKKPPEPPPISAIPVEQRNVTRQENRQTQQASPAFSASSAVQKTQAETPNLMDQFGEQQITELVQQVGEAHARSVQAHKAYLKLAQGLTESYANQVAFQMSLIEREILPSWEGSGVGYADYAKYRSAKALFSLPKQSFGTPDHRELNSPASQEGSAASKPGVFMTREQCLEFAVGSIAKVLGEKFAEVDTHPTRVRLPDEPLMLVDRIIAVEGEPCFMTHGRVITEHDILPEDWYLDCGRIPTCIAVESGQADLFLSGYLGIDFVTKGLAVYRLLDAEVTFHGDLPGPGTLLHYDIHIDEFFQQGNTHLFRFRFECTADGQLFLTMQKGCAGFFTSQELDEGRGLVFTNMDLCPIPGKMPEDWQPLTEIAPVEFYSDAQLDALRHGDLAACFGQCFAGLPLENPCRLPGGRMKLVDRILHLDPTGGRYGLGQIRGEADIHPNDWFLTCHFVDDQVMPGTLMYECCLHTLRVLLMRMGWVGEQNEIAWQPVPGVAGQLKCRGQVTASTQKVVYEISIKELGFRPEPYVISDAVMYADGRPIVRMIDMSLRLSGMTQAKLETIWSFHSPPERNEGGKNSHSGRGQGWIAPHYHRKPAIYDHNSILAFSNGKPSEAFGDRYQVFDVERVIARLPGPPYQFLDRITEVHGDPWIMTAPKSAEAQYDVPPEAWYFAANRHINMPFAVLLEIVLQPCGWLAAYIGSALTSDVDLSFRNLGGKATQFLPVTPDIGTLTTTVTLTSVSTSGGMIIQHYDYTLTNSAGAIVYQGATYFGFFTKQALAHQIGLRDAKPYEPTAEEAARGESFAYPQEPPYPDTQLRMVDQIDLYVPDGGPQGLGFIRGSKIVNPQEWFFQAHFYQDPVWPGSLGLEAFLQLLKIAAVKRWGWQPQNRVETMALHHPHEWTYRGQVIPTDRHVTIQAEITAVDDVQRFLEAQGFLIVDGRIIYQMERFTLKMS
ncbi:beta-hydroxyacyl-(acyl-carrier-protein) dehydratase, FabA/FabZ [Candidatus Vecturithrix granuli]|uniref:Beta-hydroxyacyl-(Acyl-carrier-protein) dehydratase, FabA/FabZ n=1 Tax=Vecturithrix granuli TaxID=1499967 RepID=A0A081C2P7_VECG1|nr:beta-hydroxyacyl-(acyl-carrier-protein) dehydratase, FabA/FabZ [Candidatus Vecturithrix granuli]